ncbi:MAG: site-2 protease family protein [Thiobacillus sp.]
MHSGVSLGRIAGIEIQMNWSLMIIFLLITFSLAGGVFPYWHPQWGAWLNWTTALGAAVLFLASILLHELSHALVGRRWGIGISRITLFMFGGLAHLENEPDNARAELLMALAGPATSLILGFVFLQMAAWLSGPMAIDLTQPRETLAALGPLPTLLLWLGPVNILLGVFNLVPAFPLDGGRALRALLWMLTGNLNAATRWASQLGQGFAWALMALGVMMILGLQVPVLGGGLVSGLWLAFIGWFLNNAALLSYRQLLVKQALDTVPVSQLMQTRLTRVGPEMPVATLIHDHLMTSGQRAFPVETAGRLLGLVTLRDLQRLGPDAWDRTTVGEVLTPADKLVSVSPDQNVMEVLSILGRQDLNQLPVMVKGQLVGLIRREDLIKWMSLPGQGNASVSGAGLPRL